MKLKDAIDNLLVDLNSYQIIHIVTSKAKENESITYSIGAAMINDKYIFRVEADEYIAVQTYQMDNAEKAKNKLIWLINKYSLTVESILYITNMQLNELLAKCYKNNILTYSFETKMIARKEMLISYTTISHPIDYDAFIADFEAVLKLAKDSCKKYDINLFLQQEHPLAMVRRLKLESIDIT